jgi:hypothetical protein
VITGGTAVTRRVAVAVFPVPPLADVTATELTLGPAVLPCTLVETSQLPPAGTVPPEYVKDNGTSTQAPVPPQVFVGGNPIPPGNTPAGMRSVKATPVSGTAFGLEMLIVNRDERSPASTVSGTKDLAATGGAT